MNKQKLEQKTKSEDKKKKEDKFAWFKKKFNKKTIKKPNEVAVIFLRNNGIAELRSEKTKNGFFGIEGKTYHERRDCTYTITKDRIPLAIIPEYNLTPIGTKEWHETSMQRKFNELQDHTLRGIRHAELVRSGAGGVDDNMKKLVGYGLLAIIAFAIIWGYIGK